MNFRINFLILPFILMQSIQCNDEQLNEKQETDDNGSLKIFTEKVYAKLFLMRRKENKELLNIILNESVYERKYKLIEAAYGKILKILQETKTILETTKYDPFVDKFPSKDKRLIDAITVTLENTCLFGEIALYLPDISQRILETREQQQNDKTILHWRDLISWCLKYSKYFYDRIIDAKGQQLLSLLDQEINPEKRTADFINPYRDRSDEERVKNLHNKKKTKKLKKGPRLSQHDEL